MPRTRRVLSPVAGQLYDISLVDSRKATQRDPDALIEAVKAEDIAAAFADKTATEQAAAEAEKALSFDQTRKAVQKALNGTRPTYGWTDDYGINTWIQDIYEDRAIVQDYKNDVLWSVPYTVDAEGVVTLGEAQKVRVAYEAAKAGAEFSAKNKTVLSQIKALLDRLLGVEEKENAPEVGTKAEPAEPAATEEDEMTAEEFSALLKAELAPLTSRIEAVEAAKAAAVATAVVATQAEAEAEKAHAIADAAEARAIEEARQARPAAPTTTSDAPHLGRSEEGAKVLREAAKAVRNDPSKLMGLREGLRYLTDRDPYTGRFLNR